MDQTKLLLLVCECKSKNIDMPVSLYNKNKDLN